MSIKSLWKPTAILVWLNFLFCMTGFRFDNDTWYLLALGRGIDANGGWPPWADPIIMRQDYHVVIQQWLYALGLWKAYVLTGPWGIYIISAIITLTALFVLYQVSLLASDGNRFPAALVTGTAGTFFFSIFFRIRPQVVSALFLIMALYLLESYARHRVKGKWLCLLIPLSIIFINLHGALWPMLLVIILPYIAESMAPNLSFTLPVRTFPAKPLLLVFIAVAFAGLLNPYGQDLPLYSLRAQTIGGGFHSMIQEMRPINFTISKAYIMLPFISFLFFQFSRHKAPLRYILLSLGTGYMAFLAMRSMNQFLLLGTFPIAFFLKDVTFSSFCGWCNRHLHVKTVVVDCLMILVFTLYGTNLYKLETIHSIPASTLLSGFLLFALCIASLKPHFSRKLLTLLSIFFISSASACIPMGASPYFDPYPELNPPSLSAIQYFDKYVYNDEMPKETIPLYTSFNTAPQAQFEGYRPFMDTRPEIHAKMMTKGTDDWIEFCNLQTLRTSPADFLDSHHIRYVLVDSVDTLYYLMEREPSWKQIYEDQGIRIFERMN